MECSIKIPLIVTCRDMGEMPHCGDSHQCSLVSCELHVHSLLGISIRIMPRARRMHTCDLITRLRLSNIYMIQLV